MSYKVQAQFSLFVMAMFVALTSLACGAGLALGVLRFPLAFLQGSSFSDYLIPGLVMALVVGGSALLAAAALLTGSRAAIGFAALAGLLLLAFEVAEITLIDHNTGGWLPLVVALQSAYSTLGLLMVGLAIYLGWPARSPHSARLRQASLG
ncbi:MAG TPA: hypothetical protein VF725_03805 [Ktedonobacterales bacterium]